MTSVLCFYWFGNAFAYHSLILEIRALYTYQSGGYGNWHFSNNLMYIGCSAIYTACSRSPCFDVAWQETDSREFLCHICYINPRVLQNGRRNGGRGAFRFRKVGRKNFGVIPAMADRSVMHTTVKENKLEAGPTACIKTVPTFPITRDLISP